MTNTDKKAHEASKRFSKQMQILHITLTNRIEPKNEGKICRVMKSNLFVVNKFVRFIARTNRRASHSWQFFSVLWSWSVQPLNRIYVPSAVWSKSARALTRRFSQLLVNKSIEINQYARKNRFKHPCSDILFSDHRHMAVDAKSFDIYDASQKIMNS